jgi:hypothetical protein
VTLSSFESELNCVRKYVPYFSDFIRCMCDMGFDQTEAAILWEDNFAVVQVVTNEAKYNARSRHMNIRVCYIRELHFQRVIEVRHQTTDKMLADGLTKPFSARAEAHILQTLCNDSV